MKTENSSVGARFGTGYVSIIMIFVVICLTVLAALSLSAAGINTGRNGRAHDYMKMYTEAENHANKTIMLIDEAAFKALGSSSFTTFADIISQNEGLECKKNDEGYTVSWTEKIAERTSMHYEVVVYEDPGKHERKRYQITEQKNFVNEA